MHSLFIILCFFFFRCVFATNETNFGSDADEGTFGNGTMAKAQQSPRIKWTDEEKPTADELLQNTQLFRTANAKRFQSLMSSNEERATRDEAARLRSVTKEVEEKLGLAPSPGTNRQGPTTFGISRKRGKRRKRRKAH
ncbi:hypothetical protein niasHT_025969 [Heterodera trifolii]|uniref:Uncharacterized protein n=1 Tax=Heterodera trifolii TaxID=157864 RepID=A0ABD2KNJ0_9BILA